MLVTAFSDIDTTNQSYYGEQNLHFMRTDGSLECQVPDLKEGPIHDLQWAPNGEHFIVVHGFMPAKTTLFNEKCKPVYDFGSGELGAGGRNSSHPPSCRGERNSSTD